MNGFFSNDNNEDSQLWYLRKPTQFILDVCVMSAAFFLAYAFRFDFQIPAIYLENALNQLPFVILVQSSALFLVGAYAIIWRYISLADVKTFIQAAFISAVVLLIVRLSLPESFLRWQVPLSIIFMTTGFAFGGLFGLRMLRRSFYELYEKHGFQPRRRRIKRKAALFVGAGRTGALAVKEVIGRGDAEFDVRGFIDDDKRKQGGIVGGVKVLGTTDDLPHLVEELKIDDVVIAIDQARGKEVRRVLEICQKIPVRAQIVPGLHEIVQGRVQINKIRDVQIEDLLGRDAVELDKEEIRKFLTGKVVMITGAGGSIGSELARQVAEFEPSLLLLVERAEFGLFEIDREMSVSLPQVPRVPLIADTCDEKRLREIFTTYQPEVIFHAAAHKHVPLMEANPCEAIKNNILATNLLGELAGQFSVRAFVLISTDKAVNPTSVMGASKRMAELAVQALDQQYETRYIAVRFGNVLGSAGSVVPIFRQQIQNGGPVTVTDPKMTRYFMTIPEASQLVLQAGTIGAGGEIFILDMGEPVRILDLAEDMIRLSGLQPYEDIDIEFSGIRPGEKLFEELEQDGENLGKTKHPKIFIGNLAIYPPAEVKQMLKRLGDVAERAAESEIRPLLNEFLPESKLGLNDKIESKTNSSSDKQENIIITDYKFRTAD
jgi:FlaA1/EpsC-like NDP-sugar epimerase